MLDSDSTCTDRACLVCADWPCSVCCICLRLGEQWLRWFAGNSKHIQSLIALVTTLYGCLYRDGEDGKAAAQILTVNDFLFSKGLDNLNLFRLIRSVPTPEIEGLRHALNALYNCLQ